MFIKDGKRFNPYGTHVLNGVTYSGNVLSFPAVCLQFDIREIADPVPPEDYVAEYYYRQEIEDYPFVIFTKKSDEAISQIRWQKIKAKRDEITETGGCLVAGKWFHSDAKSKQQQMALTMLGANIPAGLMWKTMDGSFVEMSAALAQAVFASQISREQLIFAHAESLKTNPTADIQEGWPDVFTPSVV